MSGNPKYCDSWRGQVLRAIILEKAVTWEEVRERSGLEHRQLFKVVRELQDAGIIEYSEKKGFRVVAEVVVKPYQSTKSQDVAESGSQQTDHLDWIARWIEDDKRCLASLENSHFFLDGPNLHEFTRRAMERARRLINVINPFVDKEGLGIALSNATKSGIAVQLITRRPINNSSRWMFHKTLVEDGAIVYYSGTEGESGGVHSKALIVDDEIAIISSMNFTSHSEGYNHEAGIVSIDKVVVESVKISIIGILDEDETRLAFDSLR